MEPINNLNAKLQLHALVDLFESNMTDDDCIQLFINYRWKGVIKCPYCLHSKRIWKYKNGKTFRCGQCKTQFSYTTGTVFENCKISMRKILIATNHVLRHTDGISSYELADDLKISQKSAHYLLCRIRKAFAQPPIKEKMEGSFEIDETYVGGKNGNRHADKKVRGTQGRSGKDKVIVLGIIQRGSSELRTKVVPRANFKYVLPFVKENIEYDSTIFSDEWCVYKRLTKFYKHKFIIHKKRQYGDGEVTCNAVEGFWRQLKDSCRAKYHYRMARKNMQMYVDECTFRYNTRKLNLHQKEQVFFSNIGYTIRYGKYTK